MRLPDFYILGAPKCGTTSLSEWLSRHSQTFISDPKEPCFFNTDLNLPHRVRTLNEYGSLFEAAGPNQIVGEATTGYLSSKVALSQILKTTPNAKFIICVRDPASLFISLHAQRLKEGYESIRDATQAWDALERRRQGKSLPAICPDAKLLDYTLFCSVGSQVRRVHELVGASRVHVIFLEDLSQKPTETYSTICTFLGIDFEKGSKPLHSNSGLVPRSLWVAQTLRLLGRARRSVRLPPLGVGRRINRRNLVTKSASETSKDRALHPVLSEYFADEVEQLATLLGRDLSHWLPHHRRPK